MSPVQHPPETSKSKRFIVPSLFQFIRMILYQLSASCAYATSQDQQLLDFKADTADAASEEGEEEAVEEVPGGRPETLFCCRECL